MALQGLRCEHGLAIMGQRLRRVVEGLVPVLAGVSEEGAAAEAEVLTETEWEDLIRVRIYVGAYVKTCIWGVFRHNMPPRPHEGAS